MKRLLYILSSILLLSACSDELAKPVAVEEGAPLTLSFSISTPEEVLIKTRTLGEMTDELQKSLNMYVLVFDENGLFVQAAKATPGDNVAHDGHTDTKFDVTLNKTSAKRILHFIAYDGGESEGIGTLISNLANHFGTEATMVADQLYTTAGQAAYWQRMEVNGITEETVFTCVPLVRNFAKVTLKVKEGVAFTINGYTIVNAPSRGAVAPYANDEFINYVNGKANKSYDDLMTYSGSTPTGTTYSTSTTLTTSGPLYLYETPNAAGDTKGRTSVIIQGTYNGTTSYYKVDLIYNNTEDETAGNLYYNLLRNFEYQLTIEEVTGAGYTTLDAAIAGAASNNLSASTATASLSRISDGVQMIEVTNVYFCFTEGGVKTQLKYRYRCYNTGDNNWTVANDLVGVAAPDATNVAESWSVADADDADGWRTITLDMKDPQAQPLNSTFHIYASASKINASSLSAEMKNELLLGELLYRDVRVDLRNPYTLIVDCPSYVAPTAGTIVQVNLLIPQNVDELLFPMDFYIEARDKYIYPDASSTVKLPVHVGETVVDGQTGSSFQYTRTVTKAEYASLETKTVNGVTYKVVPCYFKTSQANSATTVYADNEYFSRGSDEYLNVPVAFADDTEMSIASEWGEYFGKQYPVTMKFNVTPEAVAANTQFTINVAEGSETTTATVTPTTAGEYTYTYYTKTINGSSITATVSAQISGRDQEQKSSTLTLNRRYFVIAAYSFKTNITDFLDEGQTGDGSSIYVDGTYVGWFGRGLSDATDGYLTNTGPKQDYIIDRSFQNYATLTDNMPVMIQVYNPNKTITATTTIGALDQARIDGANSTFVEFVDRTE